MVDNSIFLAERLHSWRPSEPHAVLLAECYLRAQRPRQSLHILQQRASLRPLSPQAGYLLAQSALMLEDFHVAEQTLLDTIAHPDGAGSFAAPARHLLGVICQRTSRQDAAREHFQAALRADPLLFQAHVELSCAGAADSWTIDPVDGPRGDSRSASASATTHAAPSDDHHPPTTTSNNNNNNVIINNSNDNDMANATETATGAATTGTITATTNKASFASGAAGTSAGGAHTPVTPAPIAHRHPPGQATLALSSLALSGGATSSQTSGGSDGTHGPLPSTHHPPGPPGASVDTHPPQVPSRAPPLARGGGHGYPVDDDTPMPAFRGFEPTPDLATPTFRGFVATPEDAGPPTTLPLAHWETPAVAPAVAGEHHPPAVPRLTRAARQAAQLQAQQSSDRWTPAHEDSAGHGGRRFVDNEGKLRKVSNRLFADSAVVPTPDPLASNQDRDRNQDRTRTRNHHHYPPTCSGHPPVSFPHASAAVPSLGPASAAWDGGAAAVAAVRAFLAPFAEGVRLVHALQCDAALRVLAKLPSHLGDTGWVWSLRGRAHLERGAYAESAAAFRRMVQSDPCRTEGIDLFSTALWYLGREVELSHLAHTAVEMDRLAPEAWVAVGNCFSLQRDHRRALRFFRRALQLRPRDAMAHTFCGHELLALDEVNDAMASYRAAMHQSPRHYSAWYGLGQAYMRQEAWDMAEYHFLHALAIHPGSSILQCHVALAMAASGRQYHALAAMEAAVRLDPTNPLARYEMASLLLTLHRPDEALRQLEALRDLAPHEAAVHVLLGKVYNQMGAVDRAMVAYTTAIDLSPDGETNALKSALERVNMPEEAASDGL